MLSFCLTFLYIVFQLSYKTLIANTELVEKLIKNYTKKSWRTQKL